MNEQQLGASYHYCRQVCKASGSSFYPSFALLSLQRRQAMLALYAFARLTDDLGDRDAPPEIRRASLEQWRQRLQQATAGATVALQYTTAEDQVWPALADSAIRYNIPPGLLDELVQGVLLDAGHQQPKDWAAAEHYCYLVASTVGLACTHIWRKTDSVPNEAAVRCGYAFQITNFLRDVAEDARLGRIYLPQCEFDRFGVSPQAWLDGQPDGDWLKIIDVAIERAAEHYDAGWATFESLSNDSRRMFSLIWHSYRELLRQIAKDKQLLWTRRTSLTRFQKCRVFLRAMSSSRRAKT